MLHQTLPIKNLLDIGANLAAKDFSENLDLVLQEAFTSGLDKIIITGSCFDSIAKSAQIVEKYKDIYKNKLFFTAGIHPHHSDEWTSTSRDFILDYAKNPLCVATGEMGLDFYRNFVEPSTQIATFQAQLQVAIATQKPIFMHERDAYSSLVTHLKPHLKDLPKIVIHCFTGSRQALETYLELGFYIGITGWICDPKRGADLAELVKLIPQDKLMIETDSPYLMPKTIKPKPKSRTNQPKNLVYVAEKISQELQISPQEVADLTKQNAMNFFNLPN